MKSSKKNKSTKWLVVWDILGLECIFNLTEWEEKSTWAILKEEEKPKAPPLQALLLRARYNNQRKYEIYIFNSVGLTENDIVESFKSTPQAMADFIRENGSKIYSDHGSTSNQVIF